MNAPHKLKDVAQFRGTGRDEELARIRALPLSTKLILAWLSIVSLAPAVAYAREAAGIHPSGHLPVAILASVVSGAGGLLVFEPPRSLSPHAWLRQLRARFTPASSSSIHPEP